MTDDQREYVTVGLEPHGEHRPTHRFDEVTGTQEIYCTVEGDDWPCEAVRVAGKASVAGRLSPFAVICNYVDNTPQGRRLRGEDAARDILDYFRRYGYEVSVSGRHSA